MPQILLEPISSPFLDSDIVSLPPSPEILQRLWEEARQAAKVETPVRPLRLQVAEKTRVHYSYD